jgi:hypothetical protein
VQADASKRASMMCMARVERGANGVDDSSVSRHKSPPPRVLAVVRLLVVERGVAQPGSALGSGPRSRRFKSSRPDSISRNVARVYGGETRVSTISPNPGAPPVR